MCLRLSWLSLHSASTPHRVISPLASCVRLIRHELAVVMCLFVCLLIFFLPLSFFFLFYIHHLKSYLLIFPISPCLCLLPANPKRDASVVNCRKGFGDGLILQRQTNGDVWLISKSSRTIGNLQGLPSLQPDEQVETWTFVIQGCDERVFWVSFVVPCLALSPLSSLEWRRPCHLLVL